MVRVFQCFLISFFLHGCLFKSTDYTRSEIAAKVVSVCKKEYGINVKAEVFKNTLFIYIPLNDIILTAKFLSQESLKKINNVTHSASRASMSASNDIEFYKIIASDSKNLGIQLVITRYVKDIKKFMLGLISRNDYVQRMEMKIRFDPTIMGKNIIRSFFQKMEVLPPNEIIGSFFPQKINIRNISSMFFSNLMEHNMKEKKSYKILNIKSKKISPNKALVYTEVEETYKPYEKYKNYQFSSPSPHIGKYLFIININFLPKIIENIHYLHKIDPQTNKILDKGFPKKFKHYDNINSWVIDKNIDTESINLFVIRQILNHIRSSFATDPKIKDLFLISSVDGNYSKDPITHERFLNFKLNIGRDKSKQALSLMENYEITILKHVLDIIIPLIHSFEFNDFDKIRITYTPKNKTILLDSKLMKKFSRHRITVTELIKMTDPLTSSIQL